MMKTTSASMTNKKTNEFKVLSDSKILQSTVIL